MKMQSVTEEGLVEDVVVR